MARNVTCPNRNRLHPIASGAIAVAVVPPKYRKVIYEDRTDAYTGCDAGTRDTFEVSS